MILDIILWYLCCLVGYSSIVEEWFCRNRIPEWRERIVYHFRPRYDIVISEENVIV